MKPIKTWLAGFTLCSLAMGSSTLIAQDPVFGLPPAATETTPTLFDQNQPVKVDGPMDKKSVESIVADALKKDSDKKKEAEEKKKQEAEAKKRDDIVGGTRYDLQSLYDSLSDPFKEQKKWYEKIRLRGYGQFRYGRTLETDEGVPNMFADRTINGNAENFLIRRARLIFFGDLNEHVSFYLQPDFASTPQGSAALTSFGQLRDFYTDVAIDPEKVHRFRIGLSKVPYGFENMQSSQNRIPLDRTDAINTAVAPNERDLGIFYYYTPQEEQKLLKTLVDSGLKGSGNYGIFALGFYNGQGGSIFETNLNLHAVSRITMPYQLPNGQIIEGSVQAYTGRYVVTGSAIRANGAGGAITPAGTGGTRGLLDQRVAGTFVWYPQPFGFQAEWQTGRGPGLNDAQTAVVERSLSGGYLMGMYRHDTCNYGIITPYLRYQQYNGGYRNIANAPYGHQRQYDIGVEWQIWKELEIVAEYNIINTPNFTAQNVAGVKSYRDFEGTALRIQFQVNY